MNAKMFFLNKRRDAKQVSGNHFTKEVDAYNASRGVPILAGNV